jgi:hypothetical protein
METKTSSYKKTSAEKFTLIWHDPNIANEEN